MSYLCQSRSRTTDYGRPAKDCNRRTDRVEGAGRALGVRCLWVSLLRISRLRPERCGYADTTRARMLRGCCRRPPSRRRWPLLENRTFFAKAAVSYASVLQTGRGRGCVIAKPRQTPARVGCRQTGYVACLMMARSAQDAADSGLSWTLILRPSPRRLGRGRARVPAIAGHPSAGR